MWQEPTATTILNGFGISIGDSIIGLQALSIARSSGAIQGNVILARKNHPLKPLVPQLYERASDLGRVVPLATVHLKGKVIDIRDFAFDPGFASVSMIDYFLTKLDIDPSEVASDQKRNSWLKPRLRLLPDLGLPDNYILVCPKASIGLRDMPLEPYLATINYLRSRHRGRIVTQGKPISGAIGAPYCETIEELSALVAGARAIISTDTAILHLADAFSVPCLAILTTHRPEWRVRDYPYCFSYHLPISGLPESVEFIREMEDLLLVKEAWQPKGGGLSWIEPLLDQFFEFAAVLT